MDSGGYVKHYCPVRGADRQDEAENFINHMFEPDVQTEWAETGFGVTATEEAAFSYLTSDTYPSTNEEITAVDGTNISVEHGELLCFLGPSDCGKSALLRTIVIEIDALMLTQFD